MPEAIQLMAGGAGTTGTQSQVAPICSPSLHPHVTGSSRVLRGSGALESEGERVT